MKLRLTRYKRRLAVWTHEICISPGCMTSLQRTTSGLNVTAVLLCLQIHPITKSTHVHRTIPTTHMHGDSDVWAAAVVVMRCRSYEASGGSVLSWWQINALHVAHNTSSGACCRSEVLGPRRSGDSRFLQANCCYVILLQSPWLEAITPLHPSSSSSFFCSFFHHVPQLSSIHPSSVHPDTFFPVALPKLLHPETSL